MLSLLLLALTSATVQDPPAAEFLVVVVDAKTQEPIADCEVMVSAGEDEESEEGLALEQLLLHGFEYERKLHDSPLRYRTGEDGQVRIPTPEGFFAIGARLADGR